jgi:hypothetical protein
MGFKKGHKGFIKKEDYPRGENSYWFGKHHTKESIEKMRQPHKPMTEKAKENLRRINLGKHLSEETKQKQREANSGEKNYLFGKHLLEATKQKITKALLKNSLKGKNHPNWRGGINPINDTIRKSFKFKVWRDKVFKRDDWTCQKYKIKGGILHAHHIKNFYKYPELRFRVSNGITLSKKAHKEYHCIYGKKNNTKKQLKEFLNN